jgi:serine/threonine protein kinase
LTTPGNGSSGASITKH